MNINDLTIGEAKELACMFGATLNNCKQHPFIGKYVIARCYSAVVSNCLALMNNFPHSKTA